METVAQNASAKCAGGGFPILVSPHVFSTTKTSPPSTLSDRFTDLCGKHAPAYIISRMNYQPIENYGVIGNMHTAALVSRHKASVDFFCYPDFDSPTIFARLIDYDKGGYFEICPTVKVKARSPLDGPPGQEAAATSPPSLSSSSYDCDDHGHRRVYSKSFIYEDFFENHAPRLSMSHCAQASPFSNPPSSSAGLTRCAKLKTKQLYLPSSNILITRFSGKEGITQVTDLMPVKANGSPSYPWLIRKVECIRGQSSLKVTCSPSFDYARAPHTTNIIQGAGGTCFPTVAFSSAYMEMDLMYVFEDSIASPSSNADVGAASTSSMSFAPPAWQLVGVPDRLGATAVFELQEGQSIIFALRRIPIRRKSSNTHKYIYVRVA